MKNENLIFIFFIFTGDWIKLNWTSSKSETYNSIQSLTQTITDSS